MHVKAACVARTVSQLVRLVITALLLEQLALRATVLSSRVAVCQVYQASGAGWLPLQAARA
jgi:hypothetical protein